MSPAKRGDLAMIHRRLDSIARYWEPMIVVGISRSGAVKIVEDSHGYRAPLERFLRVTESSTLLVAQTAINVNAAIKAWSHIAFTDLDTVEKAKEFLRPYLK